MIITGEYLWHEAKLIGNVHELEILVAKYDFEQSTQPAPASRAFRTNHGLFPLTIFQHQCWQGPTQSRRHILEPITLAKKTPAAWGITVLTRPLGCSE